MAISKDIAIHSGNKNIQNCVRYIGNHEKTNLNSDLNKYKDNQDIKNTLKYAENTEKTLLFLDEDEDLLVTGIECEHETASISFQMDKDLYHDINGYKNLGTKVDTETGEILEKEEVDAYHIIQSFEYDKTLDPRLVHKLGLEFAERSFPGHRAVVCTHMNTNHLHNHILLNAYAIDGSKKIPMNIAFRNKYRAINDEISLEYGLPILIEPSQERTTQSYNIWLERKEGNSWKECLKKDIKEAASLSSTWKEYVDLMESNGYKVLERENYIVYTVEDAIRKGSRREERRVRDKTLGNDYLKDKILLDIENNQSKNISENQTLENSKENSKNNTPQKKKYINLHINRYSSDGRKRSDLEIMLLKAIKLIKFFMNQYWDPDKSQHFKSSPNWYSAEIKLKALEQSLDAVQKLGLENISELQEKLRQTGANLSNAKRNQADLEQIIDYAEQVKGLIERYKELQNSSIIKEFDKNKLHIQTYSDTEINNNKSKEIPITAKQRKELFSLIQDNPEIALIRKFENLSYTDAKSCIDYLKTPNSVTKPNFIVDNEIGKLINTYNKIYEQQNNALKEEYLGKSIDTGLIPKLKTIIIGRNIVNNPKEAYEFIKELDQYKALQIIKCYGDKPELLTKSTSDDDRISQAIQNQIEDLLLLSGNKEFENINIGQLSQVDGYKLKDYLLYKDKEPDISSALSNINNKKFIKELEKYPLENTSLLCEYRDLYRDLARLGIDENNIDTVIAEQNNIILEYNSTIKEIDNLSLEYKNLRNLSYNLSLTSSKSFTHGPLYVGEVVDVEIKAQGRDKVEELNTDINNKNKQNKIPDHWYDRL